MAHVSTLLPLTAAAPTGQPNRTLSTEGSAVQPDAKQGMSDAAGVGAPSTSLDAAKRHLGTVLESTSVSVEFEIDSETHRIITKVVNKGTGEVIRQIPTEEVIRMADTMARLQGLFVHETA